MYLTCGKWFPLVWCVLNVGVHTRKQHNELAFFLSWEISCDHMYLWLSDSLRMPTQDPHKMAAPCAAAERGVAYLVFYIYLWLQYQAWPLSTGGLRKYAPILGAWECPSIHTSRLARFEDGIRVLEVYFFSPDLNWNVLRTQMLASKYGQYGYWNTAEGAGLRPSFPASSQFGAESTEQ